jgi:magnesium chelatase accessory protein
MGDGPPILLLHGTGAATHSWRDVAPLFAATHTIIAPDLPGHGFSGAPAQPSDYALPSVAGALKALLRTLGVTPVAIVGHSAGAAIGVRMALDGLELPVVALNGALMPWPGPFRVWAPLMAHAFLNPVSLCWIEQRARAPGAVERLMQSTGSVLDDAGIVYYSRLLQNSAHLHGTISLMAHWDLAPLTRDLKRLRTPLALIVADRDRAVPPRIADEVCALVPHARIIAFPDAGHLAHEERPDQATALIRDALA